MLKYCKENGGFIQHLQIDSKNQNLIYLPEPPKVEEEESVNGCLCNTLRYSALVVVAPFFLSGFGVLSALVNTIFYLYCQMEKLYISHTYPSGITRTFEVLKKEMESSLILGRVTDAVLISIPILQVYLVEKNIHFTYHWLDHSAVTRYNQLLNNHRQEVIPLQPKKNQFNPNMHYIF